MLKLDVSFKGVGTMNILTIGHPDDLQTGCGGTLARMSAQGHKTTMFHVAMVDKGHTAIFPDELIAARLLGAQEVIKCVPYTIV
jgi:LmbE family N-acetylglucosaminyl deacetylase